jgi:hypothetical protein
VGKRVGGYVMVATGSLVIAVTVAVLVVLRNSYGVILLLPALTASLILWLPAVWLVAKGWRIARPRTPAR